MDRSKIFKYSLFGVLVLIAVILLFGYWVLPDLRLKDIDGYIITAGNKVVVCEEYEAQMLSSGLWFKCSGCWERTFGGWKRTGDINLHNIDSVQKNGQGN